MLALNDLSYHKHFIVCMTMTMFPHCSNCAVRCYVHATHGNRKIAGLNAQLPVRFYDSKSGYNCAGGEVEPRPADT